MHSFNPLSSTVEDILQLLSKFLSKLSENGVLKTYTFLYSENYSCVEKNYGNIVKIIEDFKGLLLKICSSLSSVRKDIIEQETFSLLNSNSLNDCIARNDESVFSGHNDYNLYSVNEIDDSINQNLRFMPNEDRSMCGNLSPSIGAECANNLQQRLNFVSHELSNDSMKSDNRAMDFTECADFSPMLKTDEQVQHSMTFSQTSDQTDITLTHKTETICFAKTSGKMDSLNTNIEALGDIKYSSCNDSLYNTLKEAISGDFLQNMKFSSSNTNQVDKNESYNEHMQYAQCQSSLQQIDLDILNNSNERINHALDGIFDDQFTEHDTLLESECWNVDINLPSAGPVQNNPDLRNGDYELSSCAENMENKSTRPEISNRMVTDFDSSNSTVLNDSMADNFSNSLGPMVETISSGLNSSISNNLNMLKKKFEGGFEREKYYCEHCGFICSTKMRLKIHLKRQHNVYINSINQCDDCGKTFRHRPALLAHIRIHRAIKPYKCQYCWKTFTQKVTHDSHVQLHTGMYKFACSVCSKRFPTRAKLNFHSKSHENPQWRCEICSKLFTTKQYLKSHEKSHNKHNLAPEKCFSCIKCNMLFEKNAELFLHIRDAHPDITFTCYFAGCTRSYSTYKKLRDHVYKKHTSAKSVEKKTLPKFQCNLCQMMFVEKNSYHRHNLLAHRKHIDSGSTFSCMQCDKQFTSESALDDHLEKFHCSTSSKDMDYPCSICGSLFYEESAVKEHMNIHSDFGTHVCQTCGSIFNEKSEYLTHLRQHDMKKEVTLKGYQCDTCDLCFVNQMELKEHELDVHNIVPNLEELKPYACLYCEKRFTTRGKCNLHTETHSEHRKYECLKCNKQFFRRDLLKEHMNTHTGYRGHVCKLCGLGFSQKSSLKVHTSTHERKDTFSCDKCDKIFQSKQALNYHVRTHEGNYAFTCDVCGKQFVRKCHYDMHVKCHSTERPFKCLKCDMAYKTNKHLRDHVKKSHQNESSISSLMNSIYTEDEMISQQSLLDEYIPPINHLQPELMFAKGQ